MNKIAVVYWSGTGNTERMAERVAEGVRAAGGQADLLTPDVFNGGKLGEYDAVAFGCPAMGAEELEESEFAPMFDALEKDLRDRKVALFGSYGWGDGQWMRDWWDRCAAAGARTCQEEGLMANEAPDDEAQEACRALGRQLAAW